MRCIPKRHISHRTKWPELTSENELKSVLLDVDSGSSIAQACLLALDDLPGECDRILDRLIGQYRSGYYKFPVLKVLGSCNASTDAYVRLLPEVGSLDDMDERVVRFLAGDEKARPKIEHHVRQLIENGGSLFHDTVELLNPSSRRRSRFAVAQVFTA